MQIGIGGEGGIRTRVGVISPQTAFEAAPLRPLRYLSAKKWEYRVAQSPNESVFAVSSLSKELSEQFAGVFLEHSGYHLDPMV